MTLAPDPQVELCQPDERHRHIIKNLGTYFAYELLPLIEDGPGSEINQHGVIGDDDALDHERGNAPQDIWWTKPGILLPMLIRADGQPAGFALVARPPHAHRSMDYRIEDFFIVNKHRRRGIGRRALELLFQRYPGRWETGWVEKNAAAASFWWSVTAPWHPEEWPLHGAPDKPPLPGLRFTVR